MAVPSAITDLSTTPASNSPGGSDTCSSTTGPDEYIRTLSAFIRTLYDAVILKAPLASPTFTGTLTGPTGVITSGTYTPTISDIANSYTLAASEFQYLRVGTVVTVSGKITANTTDATTTIIELTLPIASTFTTDAQVSGVTHVFQTGGTPIHSAGRVYSVNGGTKARVEWRGITTTGPMTGYVQFTYQVL